MQILMLYFILLFTEYARSTVRSGITSDTPMYKWIVSEIEAATDGDINSSYVSRRLAPFNLDWFRRSRQTRPRSLQTKSNETISSAKCREYADNIWKTIEVILLAGLSPQVVKIRNKMCGLANLLIAGGTTAIPGVHTHMAALGVGAEDGTFLFRCGGSLISHTWILSAAHCTQGLNGGTILVRLGTHDLRDRNSGITRSIKRVIRHPSYEPPSMYADIALLELEEAVAFGAFVTPACLYQQYGDAPPRAWVVGWGASEYAGEPNDKLQQAHLDIVDNLSCAMHYQNTSMAIPHGVSPSMICAGYLSDWKRDTCAGDSGGPLQINSKEFCLFEIVGITSFGEACTNKDSPGVYTRVSHYLDWIESIVWPDEISRITDRNPTTLFP